MTKIKSQPIFLAVLVAAVLVPRPSAGQAVAEPAVRLTARGDNLKPCLLGRPAGGLYVAWARREGGRADVYVARSTDGKALGTAVRLTPESMFLDLGAENGPDAAIDRDGRIFVVWTAGSSPAPPKSAGDPNGAHGGDEPKRGGGHPPRPGNLNIWLSRSEDDGKTFGTPIKVNDGPEAAEHRFPTVRVDSSGTVYVAWLDKRQSTPEKDNFARVYMARSTDHGSSFQANVDATARQANPICHCCRVALAVKPDGDIAIAFRNDIADLRDVFFIQTATSIGGVARPEPLERTGWRLPACPMDGPSIGFDAAGAAHVVWMNGGHVKGTPMWPGATGAGSKILYKTVPAAGGPDGEEPRILGAGHHPRLVTSPSGDCYILWEDGALRLARIERDGTPGPAPKVVAEESRSPSSPAIALGPNGSIYCAWQQLMPDDSVQLYLRRVSASPGAGHSAAVTASTARPQTNHHLSNSHRNAISGGARAALP